MAGNKLKREQKNLLSWEYRVELMDVFEMPGDYRADKETGKYARFVGYVKEWVGRVLEHNENKDEFSRLDYDAEDIPSNWWDVATKLGSGKQVINTFPQMENMGAMRKGVIYNKFLPAYRALKESFDNRSIFQWIFNHSQYTAERDAIKALTGVMLGLTGDSVEDLNRQLADYQQRVPSSGVSKEDRKEQAEEYREEKILNAKIKKYREKEAAEKAKERGGEVEEAKDEIEDRQPMNVIEASEGGLDKSFEIREKEEEMSISYYLNISL